MQQGVTLETPLEKCAIPIPGEAPALSSSQSSLQPSLDSRLLCREDHSSPVLNLGHLLPAPSCHTAPLRLRCAVMKPRLQGHSSVPCRDACRQQREDGSLRLSKHHTSNGMVVPRATGCRTRLQDKAGQAVLLPRALQHMTGTSPAAWLPSCTGLVLGPVLLAAWAPSKKHAMKMSLLWSSGKRECWFRLISDMPT